jgi:hypothetical protein
LKTDAGSEAESTMFSAAKGAIEACDPSARIDDVSAVRAQLAMALYNFAMGRDEGARISALWKSAAHKKTGKIGGSVRQGNVG